MFHNGQIAGVIIKPVRKFNDKRGWLAEIFREDDIDKEYLPVMTYISFTEAGIARGPHEHVDQADLFCFMGPSTFRIYLWDNRKDSPTYMTKHVFDAGEADPKTVLVPKGVVHAYKNIGAVSGMVINCPNRLYAGWGKKDPVDEIRHEADENSIFSIGE